MELAFLPNFSAGKRRANDFNKIVVGDEFYKAIEKGYLNEMENELTDAEKGSFFMPGNL